MKRRIFNLYVEYQKAYDAIKDDHQILTVSLLHDITDTIKTGIVNVVYMEIRVIQVSWPVSDIACEFLAMDNGIDSVRKRIRKIDNCDDTVLMMNRSHRFKCIYSELTTKTKGYLASLTKEEHMVIDGFITSLEKIYLSREHNVNCIRCVNERSKTSISLKKHLQYTLAMKYFELLNVKNIREHLIEIKN